MTKISYIIEFKLKESPKWTWRPNGRGAEENYSFAREYLSTCRKSHGDKYEYRLVQLQETRTVVS